MKPKIRAGSLRLKTWLYFLLFSGIVLIVIWLSQVFLLEGSYTEHKKSQLASIGAEIKKRLATQNFADTNRFISDSAVANNMNIFVVDAQKKVVFPKDVAELENNSLKDELFDRLIGELNRGGNAAVYRQRFDKSAIVVYGESVMLYGQQHYIYVSATLEPVLQTISVLRYQLFFITILVLLLSFILAFMFSADLSKPVLQMSRSAKRLAKRDFSVTFQGSPYFEINELARTLNYAKVELMEADEMQRQLIANVSHDLKTPLTMIKAYAEMIRDLHGEDKTKRDKATAVIINETDRLASLVGDILSVSHAGARLDALVKKTEDISGLVLETAEQFREAHGANGYEISHDITNGLYTSCGREQIRQVIYNLTANAVNYTGEDKRVFISLKKYGDLARFEVKDTGNGIPGDKQKYIWDKYQRLMETHKRPVAGSGLGLSIVKSILNAHGFNFGVISKEGEGSCFYVDFPLENPPENN